MSREPIAMKGPYRIGVDIGGTFTDLVMIDSQGHLHAFNDAQAYRAFDLYGIASAKLLNLLHGQLHDTGHFVCKWHGLDLQTRAIKKRLPEKNFHLLHLHADRTGCEVHFVCGTTQAACSQNSFQRFKERKLHQIILSSIQRNVSFIDEECF
jgi:hypothetical protein